MTASFDMSEFMKKTEPIPEPVAEDVDEEIAPELDVQKAVVEALAADKAEMDHQMNALKDEIEQVKTEMSAQKAETEKQKAEVAAKQAELEAQKAACEAQQTMIASLKAELARKEAELAAQMEKEFDQQERNPNALALLDREIEMPDRFPGETRDHVLEALVAARATAEAEGRCRKAQVLEAVLMANEPNGTLAKKRAELEKLFVENNNLITGPVLEELKKRGLSHKKGEEYLLTSEILKRNY